jgi:agmatine deiminase
MTLIQPAEWQPHDALWSAWPSHAELWLENLHPARQQVAALFRAIDDGGKGERLNILVHGDEAQTSAGIALEGTRHKLFRIPFGDIWLRDTAPIFVHDAGHVRAACFGFNGWGGKYVLPNDDKVSLAVAKTAGLPATRHDWVLEGGSIDVDGDGAALTTRQCLLNPNRNPSLDEATIDRHLYEHLGISRIIWLQDGLVNDHTDGHIDNLARFVGPNHAVVPEARDGDDPNRDIFIQARSAMEAAGLDVSVIPSVGRFENDAGEVVPASYMNFYISNSRVIVPIYGSRHDGAAIAAIAALFPGRETIGLMADAVLSGGGSFHCITQQVPSPPEETHP